MNNVYNLVLKKFFKSSDKFNNKSFLINANDDILLNKNDESKIGSGVYFKLYLSRISNDLKIKLLLYSWSNGIQTYIVLRIIHILAIEIHYVFKHFLCPCCRAVTIQRNGFHIAIHRSREITLPAIFIPLTIILV